MEHNLRRPLFSKVSEWFERKFDFTFPVEQYPNVCVRLWGAPARLEDLLCKVTPDVLVGEPQMKWSAQEHAGHMLDLEPLWMARVDDFLSDRDTLAIADLSNRKTHEANHNAQELATILAGFRTARLRLVERLKTFQPDVFARTSLHPRLKQPMRLVDHLYFVAEHDDHHLAKISELIDMNAPKC
jgi:uncharacterized damage-inducible protein DinB